MIGFGQDNFATKDGKWRARVEFDFDHDDPDELAQAISLLEHARYFVPFNTRVDNGLEGHIALFKVLEHRARERLSQQKVAAGEDLSNETPVLRPSEGQSK